MRRELEVSPLAKVYDEIEIPLVPVLVGMEETGILLDVDYLKRMSDELGGEIESLEESIYQQAGERFNLGSPQQMGVVLFEHMACRC